MSGLPTGSSANVTIISPTGTRKTLRLSDVGQTFAGIEPGAYTIIGAAAEGYSAPASQRITVIAGQISTATLAYAPIAGSLTVAVSGLPAAVSARVTVTGPRFNRTLPLAGAGTQTLSNLTPGTYAVHGTGSAAYSAPDQTVSVAAGQTATVALAYTSSVPSVGSLTVTINGLPATLSASMTVIGPGFNRTLPLAGAGTRILSTLPPGTYSVRGTGTAGYSASEQTVSVAAGQTATVLLAYTAAAPRVGSLTVMINGLPATSSGSVTVSRPGFTQTIPLAATATQTPPDLTPGIYTIRGTGPTGYSAPPARPRSSRDKPRP